MKYFLLLSVFILTGISGCDETKDIQNWVENVDTLRKTALKQAEVRPYKNDQYKALKDYFSELNQMALALKNDQGLADRFNEAVSKADLKTTCSKVFITTDQWEVMVRKCTRNRFFLCAEEVRSYREIVSALRGSLKVDQQKRFDETASCRIALRGDSHR